MKSKLFMACVAAAMVYGARAEEAQAPEGVETEEDDPIVSFELGLAFNSKYMTYGTVDGHDSIIVPSAQITFFDWVYFGVESIFDVTKGNGKRCGYGNRAGKWTTLDAIVGLAHEFDIDDDGHSVSFDLNYIYEYIERDRDYEAHGNEKMCDTQYVNLELGLGGFWVEPTLAIERDLMADNGTYVNLALAHTFDLIGEGDEAVLTLTPSVAQGFGNTQRVRGYLEKNNGEALDHGGLMDTSVQLDLEWSVCDHVTLGAYVACADYLFDSNMREGARNHNQYGMNGKRSCYDRSFNVWGGLSVAVSF